DGLLTSDGALWREQRKLIQPAFHHGHLTTYAEVMVEYARRTAASLEDGQTIDIDAEMAKLTLAIVVKTLFGADVTRDAQEVGRLMRGILEAANQRLTPPFQMPAWIPTSRNRREARAVARLDEILHGLIAARRASADRSDDLLSVLVAATDEESG